MEYIKFYSGGRWADRPRDPILEVEAGSVHKVSHELAKIVVDAGKGERVADPEVVKEEPKRGRGRPRKDTPPMIDKGAAESG